MAWAALRGDFWSLPAKITSAAILPRRSFIDCSPKTHRRLSAILDLPEPLGPTTAVMPGSNSKTVFLAKLLNPCISTFFKCTPHPSKENLILPLRNVKHLKKGEGSKILFLQSVFGSLHLAVLFGGSGAFANQTVRNINADHEIFRVIRTRFGNNFVDRSNRKPFLHEFLQLGFRVQIGLFIDDCRQLGQYKIFNKFFCRLHSLIKVDRAN